MAFNFRKLFTSPYDQMQAHIGKRFKVLKTYTKPTKKIDAEALPMFAIRFVGEKQTHMAWPEEVLLKA